MTDEVAASAETPAPEPEQTAAPEPAVEPTPEVVTEEAPQPPKVFSQEEVDAIIGKRLAKEQRKWERELQTKQPPAPELPADAPSINEFDTPEAYAEALAEHKAQKMLTEREQRRQEAELYAQHQERVEAAVEKYDDFMEVVTNPRVPFTTVMAQTIMASETGPEVAYFLGRNPDEAKRISRLSPFLQAKEIGRLEAKLADAPPVKKPSSAPAPISPVTPRQTGTPSFDTTDPRSIKSMSTSEWIEAERQRQIRKWEAAKSR
jgi:hypothetical protein